MGCGHIAGRLQEISQCPEAPEAHSREVNYVGRGCDGDAVRVHLRTEWLNELGHVLCREENTCEVRVVLGSFYYVVCSNFRYNVGKERDTAPVPSSGPLRELQQSHVSGNMLQVPV